jgi:hypothetical protein
MPCHAMLLSAHSRVATPVEVASGQVAIPGQAAPTLIYSTPAHGKPHVTRDVSTRLTFCLKAGAVRVCPGTQQVLPHVNKDHMQSWQRGLTKSGTASWWCKTPYVRVGLSISINLAAAKGGGVLTHNPDDHSTVGVCTGIPAAGTHTEHASAITTYEVKYSRVLAPNTTACC